jgi:DNA-directed RNA polymerase II subunit RPB7
MFFQKQLTHRVLLPPDCFGPALRQEVTRRLKQQVEGMCHGQLGFIIAVLSIIDISPGVIQDAYGLAAFTISYNAILLKPFKGEVIDATVSSANKVNLLLPCLPLLFPFRSHGIF